MAWAPVTFMAWEYAGGLNTPFAQYGSIVAMGSPLLVDDSRRRRLEMLRPSSEQSETNAGLPKTQAARCSTSAPQKPTGAVFGWRPVSRCGQRGARDQRPTRPTAQDQPSTELATRPTGHAMDQTA